MICRCATPTRVAAFSKSLPDDISGELVDPAVQGVIYKLFASYTVREIFSSKREEVRRLAAEQITKPCYAWIDFEFA